MEDQSSKYNNAGVQMMGMGNAHAALDLFKCALEFKLSDDRAQQIELQQRQHRCVTPELPDSISRAGIHLSRLLVLQSVPIKTGKRAKLEKQVMSISLSEQSVSDALSTDSAGYDPFLLTSPFLVPDEPKLTKLAGCVIVFNLGLVHHCCDRMSSKASSFYEISAALLASIPEATLEMILPRIALLNNFGVWCYENGEGESMRTCMLHLSTLLDTPGINLACSTKRGMQANIREFLALPSDGDSTK